MSGGSESGKRSGREENGEHASAEVFQFTLIYLPLLRPRRELLIPMPGLMARSDQPHENEKRRRDERIVAGVNRCAPYIGEHRFRD
jgi:hypothetical protein